MKNWELSFPSGLSLKGSCAWLPTTSHSSSKATTVNGIEATSFFNMSLGPGAKEIKKDIAKSPTNADSSINRAFLKLNILLSHGKTN